MEQYKKSFFSYYSLSTFLYMQGAFALCRIMKRSETVPKISSDLQGKHKRGSISANLDSVTEEVEIQSNSILLSPLNAASHPNTNNMLEIDLPNSSSDVSMVRYTDTGIAL